MLSQGSGSNTHRSTHHVAQAKVEAALLVHGVMQPRELGQCRPVVGEGVIPQAVIRAVRGHGRCRLPSAGLATQPMGQLRPLLELAGGPVCTLQLLAVLPQFPGCISVPWCKLARAGLPRSQVSIRDAPTVGRPPPNTDLRCSLPLPSPVPGIGGPKVWGLVLGPGTPGHEPCYS